MKIVFDIKQMKPGCVLLQVAMGGTVPGELFGRLFDANDWLVVPTENMGCYEITESQLDILSKKVKMGVKP